MLIAVPACAGVDNRVRIIFGMAVWITRIDAAEVGQQRDEPAVALIDAVADAMRALHFGPRKCSEFRVQSFGFKFVGATLCSSLCPTGSKLETRNSKLGTPSHLSCAWTSVAVSEWKTPRPSAEPSRSSQARSGCGIRPMTLRVRLQMPAILSREPFGFAASVGCPSRSQ